MRRRIVKHTLVCGIGMEAFVHGGRSYPCNSRWVRREDAASLLEVHPDAVGAVVATGAAPTDWRGWVSLEWVERVMAARQRRSSHA